MPKGATGASGINSQGNNYSTPGGTNSHGGESYHYSNRDGSYYYQNDNGSRYYNSGSGYERYSSAGGNTWERFSGGGQSRK
mmetsp:Transcript_24322/g.44647  ORF Transcript_24322/g.44647 Transcript_24322/m.44647 type:complete len:81 (-) Transcript_24322:56-298(-)